MMAWNQVTWVWWFTKHSFVVTNVVQQFPIPRIWLSLFQAAEFHHELHVKVFCVSEGESEPDSGSDWRREAAGCKRSSLCSWSWDAQPTDAGSLLDQFSVRFCNWNPWIPRGSGKPFRVVRWTLTWGDHSSPCPLYPLQPMIWTNPYFMDLRNPLLFETRLHMFETQRSRLLGPGRKGTLLFPSCYRQDLGPPAVQAQGAVRSWPLPYPRRLVGTALLET